MVVVSAGLRLLLADGNDDGPGRGGSDCVVKLLDSWSVQARDTQHLTEVQL